MFSMSESYKIIPSLPVIEATVKEPYEERVAYKVFEPILKGVCAYALNVTTL